MKKPQRILVFQQNGSGESKIKGIRQYGGMRYRLDIVSINDPLPPVLEDAREYLPEHLQADLVLDFLKHPDLSYDLADLCRRSNIPVVASGKKMRIEGVAAPPT